jgi:CHAD domain-containing protein
MAISPAFKAYYDRQNAYFRDQYDIASKYLLTDAIHDMRVCLKQLRSFFRLIEAIEPSFRAELSFGPARRLFKAAGKVRNIQVLEARVRQSSQDSGLDLSEYYNWLKAGERREGKGFRRVCRRFDAGFFGSAWKTIASSLEGLTSLRVRKGAEARLSGLLKSLLQETLPSRRADRLHFLRIQSKEARYTLEIVRGDGADDDDTASLDKLLRGVHQALGRWHDDEVVLATLREFRKGRIGGPVFSFRSYIEFSRLTKTSKAGNLAEFEANWKALMNRIEAPEKKAAGKEA